MQTKQPAPGSALRVSMLVGLGLILIGFVGMNFRPYSYGDMRVFAWVAIAGIISATGVLMVLGSALAWIIRRRRS
jgi:uncharacterized protein (TIGR03382 family)